MIYSSSSSKDTATQIIDSHADPTNLTKASRFALAVGVPPSIFSRTVTASTSCDAVNFVRFVRSA